MRTAGNIIAATGFTVFILAGCCLDSPGSYGTIALLAALAGLIMTYIGYRLKKIADYICWNRELRKNAAQEAPESEGVVRQSAAEYLKERIGVK